MSVTSEGRMFQVLGAIVEKTLFLDPASQNSLAYGVCNKSLLLEQMGPVWDKMAPQILLWLRTNLLSNIGLIFELNTAVLSKMLSVKRALKNHIMIFNRKYNINKQGAI